MFRILLQKLAQYSIKPVVERFYLNQERKVKVLGLNLLVGPSVFHPSLYFSSKFMGSFIQTLDLENKTVLDVGTGSGILALTAAKKGARVMAIDINPKAVETAQQNAVGNGLEVEVLQSDLFSELSQQFDVVVVNPPFFMSEVNSVAEHAWNAGEGGAYFDRFFEKLENVTHINSSVYMVLASNCNIPEITQKANAFNYTLKLIRQKDFWLEKGLIYNVSTS
jgi:release factor glutamine methyltransferase